MKQMKKKFQYWSRNKDALVILTGALWCTLMRSTDLINYHKTWENVSKQEESARERALCQLTECF